MHIDLGDNGVTTTSVDLQSVTISGIDSISELRTTIQDSNTVGLDLGLAGVSLSTVFTLNLTPGSHVQSATTLSTQITINLSLTGLKFDSVLDLNIIQQPIDFVKLIKAGNPLCGLTLVDSVNLDSVATSFESLTGPIFAGSDANSQSISVLINDGVKAFHVL